MTPAIIPLPVRVRRVGKQTLRIPGARALSLSTDQSGAYAIAGSRGRSQLTVDTQVAKVVGGMPNSLAVIAMLAE